MAKPKLKRRDVLAIYYRFWYSDADLVDIANSFRVSVSTVRDIGYGRTWSWLTGHNSDTAARAERSKKVVHLAAWQAALLAD